LVVKVQVTAGDIAIVGVEGFEIGDTIADYENQKL
jgi:predicted membrane GTPase involved in stress response